MEDPAPHILRQRLLEEGFFGMEAGRETIIESFDAITSGLELRAYGEPTIHMTSGEGHQPGIRHLHPIDRLRHRPLCMG